MSYNLPGQTITISPANPAAGATSTNLMMGLGVGNTFIPKKSGNFLVFISFDATNDTLGDSIDYFARQGTGTPPANGAAAAGNIFGSLKAEANFPGASSHLPLNSGGYLNGLTIGTSYWIDMSIVNNGGGTVTIKSILISIFEL